jgi:hypothetical protein
MEWGAMGRKTKYVVMATVWTLAFVLSLPHALISEVNKVFSNTHSVENFGLVSTADVVVFCIVPVILVAVFSGLTSV